MKLLDRLTKDILVFDGAMGTMLQQRGLKPGGLPELLNLNSADTVTSIHKEYVDAGSDIITANTFQAHELKLGDACSVEEAVEAGIKCAKASNAEFVALDVGPLGQLMRPMGEISFERAYEIYRRQIIAGEKAGADLILIETLFDLYEAKAAILAAKENTKLPVFCSMTFQEGGRTFLGCDAITAVMVLQSLGVDALGVNCSLGPKLLKSVVEAMLKYSRVPVLLQANAGLPEVRGDITVYDTTPEEYASYIAGMVADGVRIVGGCCGTNPEYIRLIKEKIGGIKPVSANPERIAACTSGRKTVIFDGSASKIGSGLNSAHSEDVRKALIDGDIDFFVDEAIEQIDEGAQIIGIHTDISENLSEIVDAIQGAVNAPLLIGCADANAVEAAVRLYNGKPAISFVSGKSDMMETLLPIAKKYGALVIAATFDENGTPAGASEKLEIARRIRDKAAECGIPEEDLLIDFE